MLSVSKKMSKFHKSLYIILNFERIYPLVNNITF